MKRTERKRAAILQAAAEEFQASGFPGTSMDRVAARAQVSKRTVYNHFESKEALFVAVFRALFERHHSALDVVYDPAEPLAAQLRALAEQEVDLLAAPDYLGLVRVGMGEAIRAPDWLETLARDLQEKEGAFEIWIREATAEGRLKAVDPSFAATQFMALLKAFAFWPQIFKGQPPPTGAERERVVASAVEMFLAHYRSEGG